MWYLVFCNEFLLDHCLDVQLYSVAILLAHFTYVPRLTLAYVFQNQQTLMFDTRENVSDRRLFDSSVVHSIISFIFIYLGTVAPPVHENCFDLR